MPSPVKAAALELGLPVTDDLAGATGVGAELGVVVAYGRIIPVAVLDRLPMVNLHFSLLPRWRGAAPVERALLEGDAETGVCLMAVEAGLDTGPVYAEEATAIEPEETRRRAAGPARRHRVPHAGGAPGRRAGRDSPYPATRRATRPTPTSCGPTSSSSTGPGRPSSCAGSCGSAGRGRPSGDARLRVLAAGPRPRDSGSLGPGELRSTVAGAGTGTRLRLVTVQPEGRRPMAAAAWLHGTRPDRASGWGGEPSRGVAAAFGEQ